jgi:hypothetical protein
MSDLTGRDMDAAVAKAIRWEVTAQFSEPHWKHPNGYRRVAAWHPSDDDADSLAALDAVLAKRLDMNVVIAYSAGARGGAGGWNVGLAWDYHPAFEAKMVRGFGATRPAAICAAILALAEKESKDA